MSLLTAIKNEKEYIDLYKIYYKVLDGETKDKEGNDYPSSTTLYNQIIAKKPSVDADNEILTSFMLILLRSTWR